MRTSLPLCALPLYLSVAYLSTSLLLTSLWIHVCLSVDPETHHRLRIHSHIYTLISLVLKILSFSLSLSHEAACQFIPYMDPEIPSFLDGMYIPPNDKLWNSKTKQKQKQKN